VSPCQPLVINGEHVGFLCGPGEYHSLRRASCPHCCIGNARTVHAWREVHSGYCAPDMLCGRCGQYWTFDHDRLPRMTQRDRASNISVVDGLKRIRAASAPGAKGKP